MSPGDRCSNDLDTDPDDRLAAGESHIVEHEYDEEMPASIAVVQAICVLADVDPIRAPVELGFVLHDHVDPDALDAMLADGTGDGEVVVSFEVSSDRTYAVEARDDGRIVVRTDPGRPA